MAVAGTVNVIPDGYSAAGDSTVVSNTVSAAGTRVGKFSHHTFLFAVCHAAQRLPRSVKLPSLLTSRPATPSRSCHSMNTLPPPAWKLPANSAHWDGPPQ